MNMNLELQKVEKGHGEDETKSFKLQGVGKKAEKEGEKSAEEIVLEMLTEDIEGKSINTDSLIKTLMQTPIKPGLHDNDNWSGNNENKVSMIDRKNAWMEKVRDGEKFFKTIKNPENGFDALTEEQLSLVTAYFYHTRYGMGINTLVYGSREKDFKREEFKEYVALAVLKYVRPEALRLFVKSLKGNDEEKNHLIDMIVDKKGKDNQGFKRLAIVLDVLRDGISMEYDQHISKEKYGISLFDVLGVAFKKNPLLFDMNSFVASQALYSYPEWVVVLLTRHGDAEMRKTAVEILGKISGYAHKKNTDSKKAIKLALITDPDVNVRKSAALECLRGSVNNGIFETLGSLEKQIIMQLEINSCDPHLASRMNCFYRDFMDELPDFVRKFPEHANKIPVMAIGDSASSKLAKSWIDRLSKDCFQSMKEGFKKAITDPNCPMEIIKLAHDYFRYYE